MTYADKVMNPQHFGHLDPIPE